MADTSIVPAPPAQVEAALVRLLHHYLRAVGYSYSALPEEVRALVSKEEAMGVLSWMKVRAVT